MEIKVNSNGKAYVGETETKEKLFSPTVLVAETKVVFPFDSI